MLKSFLRVYLPALACVLTVACGGEPTGPKRTASQLGISTPAASALSGLAFATQPIVEVRDADGNRFAGSTTAVTMTASAGATIIGTSTVNAAGGVATFASVGLSGAVGNYTLSFAAQGLSSADQTISLNAGPASQLAVATSAAGAASGAAFTTQPVVEIRDASGNRATTASASVTMTVNAGATVVGTATATAVQGVATFTDVGLNGVVGTYTLSFAAAGLTGASHTINLGAGAATRLIVATSAVGAASGAAFTTQPIVEIRDASGNRATTASASVTMTVNAGATVVGTATVTAAIGVATFTNVGMSGLIGSYTLSFAATGLQGATQTISLGAGAVAVGVLLDAETQVTRVNTSTERRPGVRFRDAVGNPVSGVAVSFTVSSGGGSVSGGALATNSLGEARVGSWTMGPVPGSNAMTVRAAGFSDGTVYARAVPPSNFPISVRLLSGTSSQYQPLMNAAADRWRKAIISPASSLQVTVAANVCFNGQPAISEFTTGIIVYAEVKSIDGVGGILAQAGTCFYRTASGLPVVGYMAFDIADLDRQVVEGSALGTVTHELGHTLRLGSGWDSWGLRSGVGTSDPIFIGTNARSAFEQIGGLSYVGRIVPLENLGGAGSRDAHWRESVMGQELMTPSILSGQTAQPFSAVTLFALADMGYGITPYGFDDYTVAPNTSVRTLAAGPVYREELELLRPRAIDSRTGKILEPAEQSALEAQVGVRAIQPPFAAIPPNTPPVQLKRLRDVP